MRPLVYSLQCADIQEAEDTAASYEHRLITNDALVAYGDDPMLQVIQREIEAERLWNSGISSLSKAEFVHIYVNQQ